MGAIRRLGLLAGLMLALVSVLPGTGAAPALAQAAAPAKADQAPPDYIAWEADAQSAEDVIAAARASTKALEEMRARIVDWRGRFEAAKGVNGPQIDTLKNQIAALGPAPADGATEAPEIAQRRRDLNDNLSKMQAPGLAAVEAFSRADGIVRQIDALIRARQASALLMLMPSPANPLHWPSGAAVLTQGMNTLWDEVGQAWANPARQIELRNHLPLIAVWLALAGLLLVRGPGFMEALSRRLQKRLALRARNMVVALVSLGQIVLPVAGMVLLVAAILQSGMTGPRLEALVRALPPAAFSFFAALWLATRLFPNEDQAAGLRLTDRPASARLYATLIGFMVAAEDFRRAFTTDVRPPLSQAAQAVWLAPAVCIVAVFVFRLGMLLRRAGQGQGAALGEALLFRTRLVALAGLALVAVSLAAPALALVGYVAAANALIWPAIGSVALAGVIILVQRFLADLYVLVTRSGDEGREALVPVLTGFLLALAALPLLALIWGARPSDLSEAWARFQAGVSLGGVQISPTALLTLGAVFTLGYMLTHLVQSAMRTSVLPRTRLDKGAQSAAVAGIGYVGLALSCLAAVTAAGINLSGLAIVAGALSVGIGFGLQNIVQNFIAGIILLIERPISEGDTIEVANKTGTVQSISVRSTRLMTGDQAEVVVPNGEFISGIVTNWTRESLKGRLILPVTVAYGSDTRKVEAILRDIVNAQPLVLIDPEPSVLLTGFAPQGLAFEVRAILSDLNFKLDVQSEMNHQIIERFAAEGIRIPFGYQEIVVRGGGTGEGAEARPAPAGVAVRGRVHAARPGSRGRVVRPDLINNDPASDPDENEELR
ncbi:MAG: DUF3772 domain-containing protein [Proteobacteria bacterium]|nr:DUF3772 domain-containing protein [Pseudomonadota bacterium]MBS0573711.1 DUF3772 domain-containing protein [Pseudomonadota bacterium]